MQMRVFGYLVELSKCGSFYAAAKHLGVSQQGLNKTIAALEAELGTKLVERSPQGVHLTRTGEVVLQHSQSIIERYDLLIDDLQAQKTPASHKEDRVRVYVSNYSAHIASVDKRYVNMVSKNLVYLEEPFDKLMRHAELSQGDDLVFVDIYAKTLQEINANPHIRFEPMIATDLGFLWKEGSPLAAEERLHRETVTKCPVALNSSREAALFFERLFEGYPFEDVRLSTSSPRLLLEYAQSSEDTVSAFDSFGFYLAQKYRAAAFPDLHFTPLSTPQARHLIGFLLPADSPLTPQARSIIEALRTHLRINCADYFKAYPLVRK